MAGNGLNKFTMENQLTTSKLFGQQNVKGRFEELLGSKTPGFITSVLQVVQNNSLLKNADPNTVLNAAATAAALDLPINQSLGFAWIVPYKGQAQFQVGWKGYVQLALRTGQYQRINVTEVYENQFTSFNRLTEELEADFSLVGEGDVVGYASHFRLNNGMEKTTYWTKEEVKSHASKYSQTYNKKNKYGKLIHSPWNDEMQFDSMAKKTVLKNMLSKWGIMSIEMQTAQLSDQSVQKEEGGYNYPDNTIDIEANEENEENERILEFIQKAETSEDLDIILESLTDDQTEEFAKEMLDKRIELTNEEE